MTSTVQPEFVNERDASVITGTPVATLRTKRSRGGGPPFYKPDGGRVVYKVTELRDWIEGTRRLPVKP